MAYKIALTVTTSMDSKSIHSFHITHNNSDYLSKFSMSTVFPFSQDDYNTQEKLKTIHMQKHGGGQTKCTIGVKVPNKKSVTCGGS